MNDINIDLLTHLAIYGLIGYMLFCYRHGCQRIERTKNWKDLDVYCTWRRFLRLDC